MRRDARCAAAWDGGGTRQLDRADAAQYPARNARCCRRARRDNAARGVYFKTKQSGTTTSVRHRRRRRRPVDAAESFDCSAWRAASTCFNAIARFSGSSSPTSKLKFDGFIAPTRAVRSLPETKYATLQRPSAASRTTQPRTPFIRAVVSPRSSTNAPTLIVGVPTVSHAPPTEGDTRADTSTPSSSPTSTQSSSVAGGIAAGEGGKGGEVEERAW